MRNRRVLLGFVIAMLAAGAPIRAETIAELFKQVRGSVVVIETLGQDLGPQAGGELITVGGLGSGVLVDSLGMVLTASHVVQTASGIRVHFADGTTYDGKVLASVPAADVALVKLDKVPVGATVARLGDSDQMEVGEQVFVVGAPLGITYTLTVGHLSAHRKSNNLMGGFFEADFLQTDAAINHGNSGGPMFNMKGEVVGIVSHMISQSGGYEGLGFAVSSNMARKLVLEEPSPWSGVDAYFLTGELARILNVPQEVGILVQRVVPASPGARLGLLDGRYRIRVEDEELVVGGDIILKVQGVPVTDLESLNRIRSMLRTITPGESLSLTVLRGGKVTELRGVMLER